MALPVNRPLDQRRLTCHSPSVGGSPIAARIAAPTRARMVKFGSVLGGAITSADCTVTVAKNGTTVGTLTIANASSAAGDLDTGEPTAVCNVNEDDIISFTPASASGSNIPATFFADFIAE
jgi:hypothetical protein